MSIHVYTKKMGNAPSFSFCGYEIQCYIVLGHLDPPMVGPWCGIWLCMLLIMAYNLM